METKSFHVTGFKAIDEAKGIGRFIASVFDVVDSGGDVVRKGAFADVIARGRKPKFVPDHNWSVLARLGKILEMEEVDEGLAVTTHFNLEKQIAKDVYSDWLFAPEDQEYSFAYDIAEGGEEKKDGVRYLTKFSEVYDIGPVGIGMHRDTHLVDVKNAAGLLDGMRLEDQSLAVRAAVKDLHRRWQEVAGLKIGKPISAARRERIAQDERAIREVADDLRALLKETDPDDEKGARQAAALIAQLEYEHARFLGVQV